jgi:hypothetical protein
MLDISKNKIAKNTNAIITSLNAETPTTVSASDIQVLDETENDVENENENEIKNKKSEVLIKKIVSNKELSDDDFMDIKLEDITKNAEYKKLNGKQKAIIHNKIISVAESKEEANINAYYICKNCYYSSPIESKTLIMTSLNTGSTSNSTSSLMYYNMDKLKNNVHSKVLPRTRHYICTNSTCKSHTIPEKKEAVFFRIGSSLQVWYACTECESIWKGE